MSMSFNRMLLGFVVCVCGLMLRFGWLTPGPEARGGWANAEPHANQQASGSLDRVLDDMVDELYGNAARSGAKGVTKYVRLEGIAWESPDGDPAGTSTLGALIGDHLETALAKKGEVLSPRDADAAKGFLGSVVRGSYKVLKTGVRVTLRMADSSAGHVISEVSREMNWGLFPEMTDSDITPPQSGEAGALAGLIKRALGGESSDFNLRVTTDRGGFGSYTVGEELTILLESAKDCYVRVYHISWEEKTMTLIFPNRAEQDGFLTAGEVRTVPNESLTYSFEVAEPFGVDALVAVASVQPFADEEDLRATWGETSENPDTISASESEDEYDDEYSYQNDQMGDDYWMEQGIDEDRVEQIVAKGLIVKYDGESASQINARKMGGEVASDLPLHHLENEIARATCFFITVKRLL